MNEPRLINDQCPLCGGKLQAKKGKFFSYASCQKCKMHFAWSPSHNMAQVEDHQVSKEADHVA